MKRTFFLFVLLALVAGAMAQSYTRVVYENHMEVQLPSGDTAFDGTGIYAGTRLLMVAGNEIFVMTGQNSSTDRVTRIPSYLPSNYGYSSGRKLANAIVPVYFQEYDQHFSFEADTMMINNVIGLDTVLQKKLIITDDTTRIIYTGTPY